MNGLIGFFLGLAVFFLGLAVVLAVALGITAVTAGRWAVDYFGEHRRARLSRREPVARYYGRLALHH